jgi:hypothetical protein
LHLDSESLAGIGVAVAEVDKNRASPIPEIILLRAGCGLGVLDEGARELESGVEACVGVEVVLCEFFEADAFGEAEQATLSESIEVAISQRRSVGGQ